MYGPKGLHREFTRLRTSHAKNKRTLITVCGTVPHRANLGEPVTSHPKRFGSRHSTERSRRVLPSVDLETVRTVTYLANLLQRNKCSRRKSTVEGKLDGTMPLVGIGGIEKTVTSHEKCPYGSQNGSFERCFDERILSYTRLSWSDAYSKLDLGGVYLEVL